MEKIPSSSAAAQWMRCRSPLPSLLRQGPLAGTPKGRCSVPTTGTTTTTTDGDDDVHSKRVPRHEEDLVCHKPPAIRWGSSREGSVKVASSLRSAAASPSESKLETDRPVTASPLFSCPNNIAHNVHRSFRLLLFCSAARSVSAPTGWCLGVPFGGGSWSGSWGVAATSQKH